jgi:hypothetical protein
MLQKVSRVDNREVIPKSSQRCRRVGGAVLEDNERRDSGAAAAGHHPQELPVQPPAGPQHPRYTQLVSKIFNFFA